MPNEPRWNQSDRSDRSKPFCRPREENACDGVVERFSTAKASRRDGGGWQISSDHIRSELPDDRTIIGFAATNVEGRSSVQLSHQNSLEIGLVAIRPRPARQPWTVSRNLPGTPRRGNRRYWQRLFFLRARKALIGCKRDKFERHFISNLVRRELSLQRSTDWIARAILKPRSPQDRLPTPSRKRTGSPSEGWAVR
ncbi:hypothetical protein CBS147326_2829 [Penicillium roqueforti]|nr:hypothetical protein CBS147326_2829 [Penicillium roqueforti]